MKLYQFLIITLKLYNITLQNIIPSLLWQGFHYEWERKIVSFQTPHRMGSIGSTLRMSSFSEKKIKGFANLKFTPGVNGDFSYPITKFQILNFDSEKLKIENFEIKFFFSDEINSEFEAFSTFNEFFEIEVGEEDEFESVLDGFDLEIKCIGDDCNSNGIWPFRIDFLADDCEVSEEVGKFDTVNDVLNKINENDKENNFDKKNEHYGQEHILKKERNLNIKKKLKCGARVIINRGWTPTNGGGKSLNSKMEYSITIKLKLFSWKDKTIKIIKNKIQKQKKSIFEIQKSTEKVNYNLKKNFVGISAFKNFGFNLYNPKYKKKGRYLTFLDFSIKSNNDYKRQIYSFDLNSTFFSPKRTTKDSFVDYNSEIVSFFFPNDILKIGNFEEIKGEVCVDDLSTLFWCKFKGMENKTEDSVEFEVDRDNLDFNGFEI